MRINEFQSDQLIGKIRMKDFFAQLRTRHTIAQMGGAQRSYLIGGTGMMGVIFLLDNTTMALGVGWQRGGKAVQSLYLWRVLDPEMEPDFAIDVPANASLDELMDQLDKFIKSPHIGITEAVDTPDAPAQAAPEAPAAPAAKKAAKPAVIVPAPEDASDDLVHRLIKKGEVVLMGRRAKGEYFIIPGMESKLKKLDAMLDKEIANKSGGLTMEEQYANMEEKVRMIVGGKSRYAKAMIITGAPSAGKALALDTLLPSPDGWTTMGEVSQGDRLFDENGQVCNVTSVTDVQFDRECYEIVFDDGTIIVADAEHRWLTTTNSSRYSQARHERLAAKKLAGWVPKPNGVDQSHKRTFPSVVNTREISASLRVHGKWNHHIDNSAPVIYEKKILPIHPRVLGMWLGDGTSSGPTMTVGSQDIDEVRFILNEYIRFEDSEVKPGIFLVRFEPRLVGLTNMFKDKLIALNLLNNKSIPEIYLHSDVDDRLELLKGIMDTDGSVDKAGRCSLSLSDEQLANDVYELISSLGIKVCLKKNKSALYGVRKKDRYRFSFTTKLEVFGLKQKADRLACGFNKSSQFRTIIATRPTLSVPVKCITVDSPNHLFLCSESFIPTHNTFRVMKVVKELGLRQGPDYIVKTGSVTDPALYRLFIEQINGLIILDDCDSIWESSNGANYLKGALNTDPVRSISKDSGRTTNVAVLSPEKRREWLLSASRVLNGKPIGDDLKTVYPKMNSKTDHSAGAYAEYLAEAQQHLAQFPPNQVDYTGRMIFISNLEKEQLNSAVLSRSVHVDLNFSDGEMLDFIELIGDKLEGANANDGITSLNDAEREEVFHYVRWKFESGGFDTPINFRFIQKCFDFRRSGGNWKMLISEL